jgi:hypothetical protein
MAEDQPQQAVEWRDDPPQQPVERRGEAVRSRELRKGLDSMEVPAPVPFSQLPDDVQAQALVGGDGASPQSAAQDVVPLDYDG